VNDIKGITARLYKPNQKTYTGTAWLCSDEYAMTAAHCVGDRKTREPMPGVFTLKFSWGSLRAVVKRSDFDLDAALLSIEGGDRIPEKVLITLGELPVEDPWPVGDTRFRWQCWGYPIGQPVGMRVSGDIEDPKGSFPEDPESYEEGKIHTGIQLTCDLGGFDNLKGLSGAPVRYDKNVIVGLVRWGPTPFGQKVIYAAPLNDIVKKFPELEKIVNDNVNSDMKQVVPNLLPSADAPTAPDAEKAAADSPAPGAAKLFGREGDIGAISKLLGGERVRLLTLVGPTGTGKTVLAQAVGRGLRDDYRNGVHFVDVSLVNDPERVAAEIAHALGVKEAKVGSLEESLIVYLGDRPTLLILDGFERLDAAGPLVERLLAKSAGLQIILTCRAPLGWPRERVYEVGPLPACAGGGARGDSPSVTLFINRARRAKAAYEFDAQTLRTIADICDRLGGLPLAIEVAAAQSAAPEYGPARVLKELGDPGGEDPAGLLARVVEMSYRSLGEDAQECLRRLTVFAGPPTPEAAAAVAGADAQADEVREALSLLLGRGLLREENLPGRGVRYRMPRPVLEYCAARLEKAREAASARRSHAAFYALLTKKAERRLNLLSSAERREWLETVEAEHDEIRAAVDWSRGGAEGSNVEVALEIVGNMFWFWNLRAYLTEGRRLADSVLAEARPALKAETEALGKALYCAGGLAFMHGDYADARELLEESVGVWTRLPNHRRLGYALVVLGMVALNQNRLDEARAHEERSVALFREVDDRWGLALALNDLGNVCLESKDYEGARTNFHKSLAVWGELEDHWGYGLTNGNLAYLAFCLGDLLTAKQLLVKASALHRDEGNQWGWAESTKRLGHVTFAEGDYARAAALFYDSMALHQRIGRKQLVADCLDGLAQVATGLGQPARAARLFGAATAIRAGIGAHMSPPQTALREANVASASAAAGRRGMTREEFRAAWAEGELWTLEDAVVEATGYVREWSA
jgi:predicted ATPase